MKKKVLIKGPILTRSGYGEQARFALRALRSQPEVFEIVTAPDAKRVFGNRWHSDQMYDQKPVKATLLFARELPPVGGDTVFSNLETAYDVFSDGMKAILEKLRIYCDGADKSRYGGKYIQ